jgi:hypothetical protein
MAELIPRSFTQQALRRRWLSRFIIQYFLVIVSDPCITAVKEIVVARVSAKEAFGI